MLQDRATSEENASRFVARVKIQGEVWGLVSRSGDWAFCPSHSDPARDVIVFWSDRAYAARQAKEDWASYAPKSIPFDQFVGAYLKVMHEDGFLIGPNWDAHLCGLELTPLEMAQRLTDDAS